MTLTGSWLAGELINDTDQQFGFFLLPGMDGEPAMAIGGVGIPFAIRKTSQHADLAAQYLDWMISPRAAQLWAEAGIVPAMPLPSDAKVEQGSLFADTVNGVGYDQQGKSCRSLHRLGYADLLRYPGCRGAEAVR